MAQYLLYGEKIINNDDSMRSIANELIDEANAIIDNTDEADYEDSFMEIIREMIVDDISRIDIDYCELMERYAGEIGILLYHLDNNGYDLSSVPVSFFENAQKSFEFLLERYVYFLKFTKDLEVNSDAKI